MAKTGVPITRRYGPHGSVNLGPRTYKRDRTGIFFLSRIPGSFPWIAPYCQPSLIIHNYFLLSSCLPRKVKKYLPPGIGTYFKHVDYILLLVGRYAIAGWPSCLQVPYNTGSWARVPIPYSLSMCGTAVIYFLVKIPTLNYPLICRHDMLR